MFPTLVPSTNPTLVPSTNTDKEQAAIDLTRDSIKEMHVVNIIYIYIYGSCKTGIISSSGEADYGTDEVYIDV